MTPANQPPEKSPRLAVRAVIVRAERLLLVNAWPGGRSDLLCAPGGGVHRGTSLPHNLAREVFEECGLAIDVGDPCLVNEFHDPTTGFHQVEVFFRCTVHGSAKIDPAWRDAGRVVCEHHWLTATDVKTRRVKPDTLAEVAFGSGRGFSYDALERIVS